MVPRGKAMRVAEGRGENRTLGEQKGGVTIRKSLERGMAACLLTPSLSVLSVRPNWAKEGAGGKVA